MRSEWDTPEDVLLSAEKERKNKLPDNSNLQIENGFSFSTKKEKEKHDTTTENNTTRRLNIHFVGMGFHIVTSLIKRNYLPQFDV